MRVIELTIALIGLSLFGSEAFLGDFGLAINDKSGKPIVETDPDQVRHTSGLEIRQLKRLKKHQELRSLDVDLKIQKFGD